MSKKRVLFNESIQESVKLHLLAAVDPLIPESIRKIAGLRHADHVLVLDIDAQDPMAMRSYARLKANHRVDAQALLLDEQSSGNRLKAFLLPWQECIMALEETGIYEPSSGNSAKIRSALAAVSSEDEIDPYRDARRR